MQEVQQKPHVYSQQFFKGNFEVYCKYMYCQRRTQDPGNISIVNQTFTGLNTPDILKFHWLEGTVEISPSQCVKIGHIFPYISGEKRQGRL